MSKLHAALIGSAMAFVLCVLVGLFFVLRSDPSTKELDADLSALKIQLAEADAEAAKYDAGLLRAYIDLRREVLKTTQAMLEQKRSSLLRRVNLQYTVRSTQEAPATSEQLAELSADIAKAQAELDAEKIKADRSGGLIQIVSLMTVTTHRLRIAQLNLSYYSAKYGLKLPQLKLPPMPTKENLNAELSTVLGDRAVPGSEVAKSGTAVIDPVLAEEAKVKTRLEALRTAWQVESDVSPLDKSPRVILTRMSETKSVDDMNTAGFLGLRCMEGRTSVAIATGEYLGFSETVLVDYRIGSNKPSRDTWGLGGDNKMVFAPSGAKSIELIGQMQAADDFYIRIYPERDDSKSFMFDIRGLADHVAKLKEACSWDESKQEPVKPITDRLDQSTASEAAEATVATETSQPKEKARTVGLAPQYVVQVGSKRNQTDALAFFADLQRNHTTLLASYRPIVQKVDLGTKGIWYRLRIGPIDNSDKAKSLCAKLKSRGLPDCVVVLAAAPTNSPD